MIRQELKSAGARGREVDQLAAIASNLRQLKSASHHKRRSWRTTMLPAGITATAGLALGMALIILSQTVLPGSRLYPVQKLSDNAAIAIHPQYRGTIMMRRARQVQQLVAARAGSTTVLAALDDYQVEASAYKSSTANYAMFEHCKTSLRQAAAAAPQSERQAIDQDLAALNDV
jgi:hypothetical protein